MKTTQALKKTRGSSRLKKQKSIKIKSDRSLTDLFLGLFSFTSLILLMFYRSPSDIIHFILPNSYLPFLLPIFFTIFFLLKFIFLRQRLAFCISFSILILLFFYLQNLSFNYYLIIVLVLAPLIWIIINQIEKRLL
jgi:hypothetical protein